MRSTRALVIAVALVLAGPLASSGTQNDANLGSDASNDPAAPSLLPGFGRYTGDLEPRDQDWYRVVAARTTPTCVEARVASNGHFEIDLTVRSDTVERRVRATSHTVLNDTKFVHANVGIVLAQLAGSRLGLVDVPSPAPPAEGADPYGFRWQALSLGDLGAGDGGSGRDAGASASEAVPLPGPCVGGALVASQVDLRDLYAFTAKRGTRALLSFETVNNLTSIATLVSPSGRTLGGVPASEDEAFVLDEDGVWHLAVALVDTSGLGLTPPTPVAASTSAARVDYVIGIGLDPDPYTCRPTCL